MKKFLSLNSTAKVYIRRQAFDEHYIKVLKIPFSVGLDKELMNNEYNKAEVIVNDKIATVLGGFHLVNPPTKKYESDELIDSVAAALNEKNSNYYTCHCTGEKAYDRMKSVLGDRLHYLATGAEVILYEEN